EKADVIALTKAIRQQLKKLSLSPKVRLVSVYSQADEVAAQIHTFFINLLQGLVLVAFILFLVLGIRPALMIGCFIPLSSFIGLMITNYFGLGLNQMTIVGMIVSLGLLVDNSIAIVENIERLLDEGSSIFDACVQGVNQLLYPMLSSTLTTIAVFIPIIFMPETTGAFIKPMPVVVVFTMIASLLVAITLAPVLCYFYLHRKDKKPLAKWLHWLNEQYHRWLVQAIEHTKTSMAVMLACFLLALLIFPLVGVTFFPKSDKKYFYITVETAKGTNLQHTNQIVASIEQNLSQMEEILAYTTSVGHGNPAIYYNVGFHPYAHNFGEIFVETKLDNKKQFNQFVQQVRSKLNQITEAKINVKEYSQGLPAQYPLEIIVLGDNFDELKQINQSIVRIMRQQESIININNSIESKTINLLFAIDYLKAAQLGVPEKAIEKAIKNIFEGSTIGRFTSDDNEQLAIKLRYQFNPQESLEAIQKIRLSNQQGEEIALDQLVKMELNNSINQLEHLNYDRMASVSADLVDAKHFDSVVEQLRTALDALPWKNGYTYAFKGDFENRNASFGSLGYASLVALMLILMILIAQYKSFLIPLIILAILPLSITGATFALYLTGQSFSFSAFIGLISLMGICINDSIILVDFSKTLFHQGYTGREAALQAARIRFIPVLMTSVTTILGLIFLALNGGSLWMPMAITIIGGLMGTTFFVLFLIPILFVQMSRFIEKDLDRDIVLTN
ncbi:MAG: efflux RND transporter permease subunit, partial [Bacteroidota bacterium]